MLHYLRIAVTALSLTACVLLVALWVRSQTWGDSLSVQLPWLFIKLESEDGRCAFVFSAEQDASQPSGISFHSWEPRLSKQKIIFPFFDLSPQFDVFWMAVDFWALLVPHWFLVLLFAASAILCIKWSRRFSLSTLLIATTLVALGLGIIVACS
jgi:hypothetical protein